MSDFFWGQGDTGGDFTETLRDENGVAVDIAAATIHLTVTPNRGGAAIIDTNINNLQNGDGSDGSKGKVSYTPTAGVTDTPGDYFAKITVTYSGGGIQTFPNTGFIIITITPTAAGQQRRYVGVDELKNTMSAMGTSFLDEDLDVAIEAASRYLEADFNDGKPWTKTSAGLTRYYTRTDDWEVELGDVLAVTSVDLDYSTNPWVDDPAYGPGWGSPLGWGGGSYGTNLAASSYRLLPTTSGLVASGGNGEPYRLLDLARGTSVYRLPSGRDAIRITGTFGWETVPMAVKMATSMIASRLMRRMRDAPFGIVGFGSDDRAIAVRQIATDPDIQAVMMPVSAVTTKLFA